MQTYVMQGHYVVEVPVSNEAYNPLDLTFTKHRYLLKQWNIGPYAKRAIYVHENMTAQEADVAFSEILSKIFDIFVEA